MSSLTYFLMIVEFFVFCFLFFGTIVFLIVTVRVLALLLDLFFPLSPASQGVRESKISRGSEGTGDIRWARRADRRGVRGRSMTPMKRVTRVKKNEESLSELLRLK